MKLFVIYLGGSHPNALIELHDIRIVIAEELEDTYEELRRTWWGAPETLHLDAWGVLNYADGHKIKISSKPQHDLGKKLYFVNLGGYDSSEFTELHKNVFVVAENESKAKVRALRQILGWQSHHRDYLFEAEKIIEISRLISANDLHIHLEPSETEEEFEFICKYIPIGSENVNSK